MEIQILKEDILPYIYFVSSIAQGSKNGMYGSLSAKSDLIGGIFDRWINIIPESVSFNKYYLNKANTSNKDVKVFSDFYIYEPNKVGIAPDVFGLQINKSIVPFVKYDDSLSAKDYWVPQQDCPQIEIKSFFGKKYMVSLRNQNYEGKYLVLISAKIDSDYLLSFFNEKLFLNISQKLVMPDNSFVISNDKRLLSQTKKVDFDKDSFGSIEILGTTTASDFMRIALKLNSGDIPRYLKSIDERKRLIKEEKYKVIKTLDYYCYYNEDTKLYRFNNYWYDLFSNDKEKTLDITIENPQNILVINKTNNAITILLLGDAKINKQPLVKDKQYNVSFDTFGSIKNDEYFLSKDLIEFLPNKESELIQKLEIIINNN